MEPISFGREWRARPSLRSGGSSLFCGKKSPFLHFIYCLNTTSASQSSVLKIGLHFTTPRTLAAEGGDSSKFCPDLIVASIHLKCPPFGFNRPDPTTRVILPYSISMINMPPRTSINEPENVQPGIKFWTVWKLLNGSCSSWEGEDEEEEDFMRV